MRIGMSLVAVASLFISFAHPAYAEEDARAAIEAANTSFEEALNKGDAKSVAAAYAEDASLLPPGEQMISGRDNIEAYWKGAIGAGISKLDLVTKEVEASGNFAAEVGELTYEMPGSGGAKTAAAGKYIVLWKKEGDSWKLYRDMWNDTPKK